MALLPLARDACAAMDEGDEAEVLRLSCGESQKRTLRRLGRQIDDLRLCRTTADLPGEEPVVIELRNIHENNGAAEDVAPYTGSYDGIVAFERNGGTRSRR